MHLPLHHFSPNLSSKLHRMILPHHTFPTTPNYGHILIGPLVQLTAATFILPLPHTFILPVGTEKAIFLKTAYFPVPSTFFSPMLSQDGRDPLRMPEYMRMQSLLILSFRMDGIFWPMLAFHIATNF